jgi:hypothetical protein
MLFIGVVHPPTGEWPVPPYTKIDRTPVVRDVTVYGLFVEHYQEFQVVWNGNGGRVYFYQSEIPYDPPDQASYTSAPGTNGWASYKVNDGVTRHEAWGLGI